MNTLGKFTLYLQAAAALRSPHWRGLPLIPKSLCPGVPYSRHACNSFIIWIKQLDLPSAKLIVDVGANHGDFANAASIWFPDAKVVVAEPLPKMQRYLEQIIRARRNKWHLLPCAIGAERGTLPLFVDEGRDDIASLVGFSEEYRRANTQARLAGEMLCEVKTLDETASEMGIDHIDLLKIDVEGFEFEVLKGAGQILQKTDAVIIEVSLVRNAGTSSPLVEMLDRLVRHGFQIVNVIPSLLDTNEPWKPCEFNILARRGAKSP
ncbi:MAG: FkbM family methyltransferase [Verrucomicrobiia bacterium]